MSIYIYLFLYIYSFISIYLSICLYIYIFLSIYLSMYISILFNPRLTDMFVKSMKFDPSICQCILLSYFYVSSTPGWPTCLWRTWSSTHLCIFLSYFYVSSIPGWPTCLWRTWSSTHLSVYVYFYLISTYHQPQVDRHVCEEHEVRREVHHQPVPAQEHAQSCRVRKKGMAKYLFSLNNHVKKIILHETYYTSYNAVAVLRYLIFYGFCIPRVAENQSFF